MLSLIILILVGGIIAAALALFGIQFLSAIGFFPGEEEE